MAAVSASLPRSVGVGVGTGLPGTSSGGGVPWLGAGQALRVGGMVIRVTNQALVV